MSTTSTNTATAGADPGTTTTTTTTTTTGATEPTSTTGTTGTDSATTGDPLPPAACSVDAQLVHGDFVDMSLRCAVAKALEPMVDPVDCEFTCAEVKSITLLNAFDLGIVSTVGIRHLVNLTDLKLPGNNIQEIVDFHTLTKLTKLHLFNNKLTSTAGLKETST